MEKESIKYTRQIIDDYYQPREVPHCALEESAKSENERLNWHNANRRFAACAAMYEWLDNQGILKKESFCYDVIPERMIDDVLHNKQINFAIDSETLVKYRDQMLASGVSDADLAVSYILAEDKNVVEPSCISGAVCLTWVMQTYRDSCGCVGRSWETLHEQHYYLDSQTGIGETSSLYHEAKLGLQGGVLTEDEYFNMVKKGISLIYKQDRTVYLSNVPAFFVRTTKNPATLSVALPCDNSKSDDGKMRLFVNVSDVSTDRYGKKIINIGDVESYIKVSVKKNGEYQSIEEPTLELAKRWYADRKEHAENYKKTRNAPVCIKGIHPNNIKDAGKENGQDGYERSKVTLPNIGTFYIYTSRLSQTENGIDVDFSSGLESVWLYTIEENMGKTKTRMNAYNIAQLWEKQQSERQQTSPEEDVEQEK